MSEPPRPLWPRQAGPLWVLLFCLLTLTTGVKAISGDSRLMCMAASSLKNEGSLGLSRSVRADVVRGRDGKHYVKYPLLAVLQCVPAVAARSGVRALAGEGSPLEDLAIGAVPAAVGATLGTGFFLLARQLGFGALLSVVAALLLMLTTPHFHFARTLYSENLQATFVVWSMLLWLRARARASGGRLAALGAVLGAAIHAKALLVVLGVAVLVDWLLDRPSPRELLRRSGFTLAGAAPGLVAWLGYNWLRYGDVMQAGYGSERDGLIGFGTPLLAGLHGLLLSPGKSLFLYAPLTLVALFGVGAMARAQPRALVFATIVGGAMLGTSATWWAWSGDWTWGPRLLVGALPLYALPALWVLPRPGRARRVLVTAACAFGLYVGVLGISLKPAQYIGVAHAAIKASVGKPARGVPMRDDLVILHQVPELSPVVGHAWLLSRYVSRRPWTEHSYYPWRSLGIHNWRVRRDPTPKYVCYWFDASSAAWVAAGFGVLATLGAAWWLRRRLA